MGMCTVTIDDVKGYEDKNGLVVKIVIKGSATEPCAYVHVTFNCGFPVDTTVPVQGGKWEATVSTADGWALGNCGCGNVLTIYVQCWQSLTPGPPIECNTPPWSYPLECIPLCPEPAFLLPAVAKNCNADLTRTVTNLGAILDEPDLAGTTIEAKLRWVEGNIDLVPVQSTQSGLLPLGPVQHNFPGGPQTIECVVTAPKPCAGATFMFSVDPCDKSGPTGACCVKAPVGGTTCKQMSKAQCLSQGGTPMGDGVDCTDDLCTGKSPPKTKKPGTSNQPGGGGGTPSCGDGLIWAAMISFFFGVLLLAMHMCLAGIAPQLGMTAWVCGWALIVLCALLLAIWAISGFFNTCKIDECHAAVMFIAMLAILSAVLTVFKLAFPFCFWNPVWALVSAMGVVWAAVNTKCFGDN
jgi:hypothetical protein